MARARCRPIRMFDGGGWVVLLFEDAYMSGTCPSDEAHKCRDVKDPKKAKKKKKFGRRTKNKTI